MLAAEYKVGDRVRAKEAIYEPADDHAPGGYICGKGDLLIVRKVRATGKWPLSVSHEDVTDNSFSCGLDEVVPESAAAALAGDGSRQNQVSSMDADRGGERG